MSTPKQETMMTADGQVSIIRVSEFDKWLINTMSVHNHRILKLEDIAIYVRDNHLCGTPLLKAINSVVSYYNKETKITKV